MYESHTLLLEAHFPTIAEIDPECMCGKKVPLVLSIQTVLLVAALHVKSAAVSRI